MSNSALHIVNEASIRALREVAQKKYDHEINNFDHSIFRPNILIDQEPAYCEEEMYEARIENMLIRHVGPCSRCKLTSINWDKLERDEDMEPYTTIMKTRQCVHQGKKLGAIFGTYVQPDFFKQSQMPEIKLTRDEGDKIYKTDPIHIRVEERKYQVTAQQ